MNKRFMMAALVAVFMLLSACSSEQTSQEKEEIIDVEVSKKEDELNKFMIDVKDSKSWMQVAPGKYSGDHSDLEAIKKEIAEWPEGLTSEEYFTRLMALTAEDYRPYQKFLDETKVMFSEMTDRPDGMQVAGDNGETAALHVQVLLDASGSMAGKLDGQTKMSLAKEAIADFVANLPENTHVSLRVYGHEGSNQPDGKALSCSKTEEVYTLGTYDQKAFADALNQFQPTGFTPIAKAIEDAGQDLLKASEGKNVKNVIYVVSDGEETCGGDPIKAAKEIQQSNIQAVVNIIGFDIQASERKALEAIAAAGNGQYFHADTGNALRDTFRKERNALINEWFNWGSQNVNTYCEEQSRYVNDAFKYESEAKNLSHAEEQLQRDLTRYMEEIREDIDTIKLRSLISSRSVGMRSYLSDQFYAIREEARDTGYELREKVRDEAYNERQKLREENRK